MKPFPFSSSSARRILPLVASLIVCSFAMGAAAPSNPDQAAQLLTARGYIVVSSAGKFVAPGTFRVQVLAKLGRPDLTLADGTLLYHHRRVDESNATGTLVVRFVEGRVTTLALVTPTVVAALRDNPRALDTTDLVAAR